MLPLVHQFIYRPDATSTPAGFTPDQLGLAYEAVSVQTSDGIALSGWYLPAPDARHALLYCHGNAGDIRDWTHAAPPFVNEGVSLLMWDYRGYGRSEGQPSEEGLYRDGEAMWQWLAQRAEIEGMAASILGKSLGSAVAIYLATKHRPKTLILDSAFTSMREVVVNVTPWVPVHLVPQLYESIERVPRITCPTLLLHGKQDELVPVNHARRIYEALRAPKALRIIERAGHNTITSYPQYHQWILQFLDEPEALVEDGER